MPWPGTTIVIHSGSRGNVLIRTKTLKRQKYQFRWAVAGGAVWHWDRINAWLDGGKPEREWEFKQPSETTLRIAVRDATMLDTLFITSNVKAKDPSAANVRLFQLRKTGRFRLKS